jgi:plasmid stabilization system protein ParE
VKVVITPQAEMDLAEIWEWNAQDRGVRHADRYLVFLKKAIYALSNPLVKGRSVPARQDLSFIIIKRRAKGHGHIAVYSVQGNEVIVAHVFHTSQDWENKLP